MDVCGSNFVAYFLFHSPIARKSLRLSPYSTDFSTMYIHGVTLVSVYTVKSEKDLSELAVRVLVLPCNVAQSIPSQNVYIRPVRHCG